MIKFVASDLDGTLLNDKKLLPEGIFDTIERMYKKGIIFAPASGRQYANLKKLFEPVKDKIIFICETARLSDTKAKRFLLLPPTTKA